MTINIFPDARAFLEEEAKAVAKVFALQTSVKRIHKRVYGNVIKIKSRAQELQTANTNVFQINFAIGDYYLI